MAQEGFWVAITPPLLPGYPNWPAQGRSLPFCQDLADKEEIPPLLPGLFGPFGWNGQGGKSVQAVRNRNSSVLASLGTQAEGEGDSHFRLVLGLPYTITINIPWRQPMETRRNVEKENEVRLM